MPAAEDDGTERMRQGGGLPINFAARHADFLFANGMAIANRCGNIRAPCAPVAQLDRAPGYEPGGREFESLRAHHIINELGMPRNFPFTPSDQKVTWVSTSRSKIFERWAASETRYPKLH